MSESTSSSSPGYFKLGLFVIIGTALIVAGVLVLGGASLFKGHIKAQTVVTASVNGLDVGAAVKYRGVAIGKVSGIQVAGAKYGLHADHVGAGADTGAGAIVLEMSIETKAFPGSTNAQIDSLLRRLADDGLRARVTTAGFSGQAYIDLNFLDPKAYPPPQISFVPNGLYIPSAPSALNQALDAVEHIAIDLQKANLPKLVTHYDELATRATVAIDNVNALVKDNRPALDTAMADLPDIAERTRSITSRADALLKDPRLARFLASLPATGENANGAISDLRALLHDTQGILAEYKDALGGILTDVRRAAADAAVISEDAKQNPARVLFGQPPPHLKKGQ